MDTGFIDSQMYKIKQGCVGLIAIYNIVDNMTANSTFIDEQKKFIASKYGELKTYHWKSLRQKKLRPLNEVSFKSIKIQKDALSNVVCYQSS